MALRLAPAAARTRTRTGAARVAAGAVLVALLGGAFVLGRLTAPAAGPIARPGSAGQAEPAPAGADEGEGPAGAPVEDAAVPVEDAGPGPTGVRNDVPVGYTRTEQGAVAAATGYLSAIGDKRAFNREWRERAYRTMADPAVADELLASVAPSYARIDGDLGLGDAAAYDGSILAVTVPVGYRVDEYGDDRASITVWAAGWLTRMSGPQLPLRAQTSTMELVWTEGDWKLTGVTGIEPLDPPGVAAPVTDQALAEMRGFTAYEYRPVERR